MGVRVRDEKSARPLTPQTTTDRRTAGADGRDRPLPGRRLHGGGDQGPGDGGEVAGHGAAGLCGPVVAALLVEVVGSGAGTEVPVGPGLAGDGVADVAESAGDLADHVVGAVLVASVDHACDAVVGDRAALV